MKQVKPTTKVTYIRLTIAMLEQAKALAASQRRSLASWLQIAVEAEINKQAKKISESLP